MSMRRTLLTLLSTIWCSLLFSQTLHQVQRGETYALIASRYGISVEELMAANPDSDGCFVGMEINIPEGRQKSNQISFLTPKDLARMDAAYDYLNRGKYKKAIKAYSEVIKISPSATAYFNRGIGYYNSEKYKSAIEDFETAQYRSDCADGLKERCVELIGKAKELRREQHKRRNSLWGRITAVLVGTAAVTATTYMAAKLNGAGDTQNYTYGGSGAGSNHLSRSDAIIAQSQANINRMMAQGNLQLQQMTQQTMIQAQNAKQHIEEVNREQMQWVIDFTKKNGRSPTDAEIDMWLFNNHHDIWLLNAQTKANSTIGSNDDKNDDYSQESNAGQYEASYRRYERLVESHFNSLTVAGGAKVKDKQGNISGKTNGEMKSWAYVGISGNFRDAQREMTKIRLEAKKHGINIVQSKWETATVNY